VGDSTYVLDGLLYQESDYVLKSATPGPNGFTDDVFALMRLLSCRFVQRIRDLGDTKLYIQGKPSDYAAPAAMINERHIRSHRGEILPLTTPLK
jgi:TnpA family transposase